MRQNLLLLTACALLVISCTKNNNNNTTAGKVLHGSPNYYDSLTINTSTYTILYLGSIYTYTPNSVPTANYLTLSINYNGSKVTDATLTNGTNTSLQMVGMNTIFQSNLYIGL